MVRLITHNMLSCHVSKYLPFLPLPFTLTDPPPENCTKDNYPLEFHDAVVEIRPAEPNLGFIERFLPKLEWSALVRTARALGNETLPDTMPEDKEQLRSEEFLLALHRVLMETHVEEGSMVCRGCGHVYQISSGIPNMVSCLGDAEGFGC